MADIGRFNTLTVLRLTGHGAILDGNTDEGSDGDILLPTRVVPADATAGMALRVFVYVDSEDRLIATTQTPLAQVGEVAWLKIVAENDAGIFLDWGLPKDLMLPWNEVPLEQKRHLEPGRYVMVMVFQDRSRRIAASARLDDFLAREGGGFNEGDKVSLLIGDRTELGLRVVVNNRYWGLVHNNEIFGTVRKGDQRNGWIKTLRSDRRLNLALTPPGHDKIDSVAQGILDKITNNGGFMAVTDKSPPEAIYKLFGVSKKVFKQAIGSLYKNRLILIEDAGLRIITQ
jgi:predicted RNA-binding protein (virulence factor B family)